MKENVILLIDNTFKDIENFVEIFKGEDVSIITAVTIKKAHAVLEYIIPDLIVSEMMLEDGSGLDIFNFIKSHDDYASTPFIFLSNEADPKKKISALSHGVEEFFTKPFSVEELKIRVYRILKKFHVKRFDIDRRIFSSTENLSLVEIIQFLEKTQKTGIFTFFTKHKVGTMVIKKGEITSACFGAETGEEAVYQIIALQNGIYEFSFIDHPCETQIQQGTQRLLLEALRRVDESGEWNARAEEQADNRFAVICIGFTEKQILHLFDENVYHVTIYASPLKALEAIQSFIPNLLVVNPNMKEMNGYDLLKRLSDATSTYHLPAVFISSSKSEEEKVRALKEGVAEYIMPPITKFEFDRKLKKIIRESMLKQKEYSNVLRGSLHNFSILEVIQGIQGIEKTCKASFFNGDDSCTLFFSKGTLANAKIKHQEGEEAVYKILTWNRGYFEIMFRDYQIPKRIGTSTFNLVLEGIAKSMEADKEVVEMSYKSSSATGKKKKTEKTVNIGLYNFILETAKLKASDTYLFNSVRLGKLENFMRNTGKKILFVDLNLVEKEALDELLSLRKTMFDKIEAGLDIICFTSRPDIYGVHGAQNKFSWLVNFDDTKEIQESLSDKIVIKTNVDFFEFNKIIKSMYYTAAFPDGFGSPEYRPLLFSADGSPVALYRKFGRGLVFLMPQQQSKEDFINFFLESLFPKIASMLEK